MKLPKVMRRVMFMTMLCFLALMLLLSSGSQQRVEAASSTTNSSAAQSAIPELQVMDVELVELRAGNTDAFTQVASRTKVTRAPQTATINVTYNGFSPAAEAAFQYAVDIWETQISSPVTIEVTANWTALSPGVLGSAGANGAFANFSGAPLTNTFYPQPLANALHGSDLDPQTDLRANFNSTFSNWYFGTDGNTPAGQYDFVTVVMHELGHGLGFSGSATVMSGQGSWGGTTGFPYIYDTFVENGSGQDIIDTALFPNPSTALAAQLQGGDLFFNGTNAMAANGGSAPELYAPASWQQGSSYSHLDEAVFAAGNSNSLMTPQLGSAEAIHDPGDITRGMFKDMGWPMKSQIQPHMIAVLDRSGSMNNIRLTGNTRCVDSVARAQTKINDFFNDNPNGLAAVWTFAGASNTDHTGFVNQATAIAALSSLPSCGGSTPLADAVCDAADALNGTGAVVKNVYVSSDGEENSSNGACDGPASTSGPPIYDVNSWHYKVKDKLVTSGITGDVDFWGTVARSPAAADDVDSETGEPRAPNSVPITEFLQDLATSTNGSYSLINDNQPIGTVTLRLSPSTAHTGVGQTFNQSIVVEADMQQVDDAEAHLNFDPAFLQVVSITAGSDLSNVTQNQFDNATGQLDFAANISSTLAPSGTFSLATVTFSTITDTSVITNSVETLINFNATSSRRSGTAFNGSSVFDTSYGSRAIIDNASFVIGSVTLQGRPAAPDVSWSVPLSVTLTTPGNPSPTYHFTSTTNDSGEFSLAGISAGSYEVRVKHSHSLQNMQTVNLLGGNNTIDFGTLQEGDANNDNAVDILDFSVLATAFGTCQADANYNEQADFNASTCVDILDFSLLATNFGQSGPNMSLTSSSTSDTSTPEPRDVFMVVKGPSTSVAAGETLNVDVEIQAGTQLVDGAQVALNFDPAVLEVQNITAGSAFSLDLLNQFDNTTGTIDFAAGTFEDLPSGTFELLQIELRTLEATADTPLSFEFGSSRNTAVTFGGVSVLTEHEQSPTSITLETLNVMQPSTSKQWLLGSLTLTLLAGLLIIRRRRQR